LEEVASDFLKEDEKRALSAARIARCGHAIVGTHRATISAIPGMSFPPKTAGCRSAD
jgi:hypothetical protein